MVLDRARVLIGSAIKTRRGTCPRESRARIYARSRRQNETQARTCNSSVERSRGGDGQADGRLMRANGKEKEGIGGKQGGGQLPPRRIIESA